MVEKVVSTGAAAPDFSLKDQNGNVVGLSNMRGTGIVLAFHPLAWTSVCTLQMQDLENNRERFEALRAVALGISVDSVPCKKAWARSIGVEKTRLLADFWPHGGVADLYGVFRQDDGFSERAVFILDAKGVIRFRKVYPISERPDIDEILRALGGI